MDIYQENGYSNRMDYLESMATDYDLPKHVVWTLADLLGPEEDFDGLVSTLEDLI